MTTSTVFGLRELQYAPRTLLPTLKVDPDATANNEIVNTSRAI